MRTHDPLCGWVGRSTPDPCPECDLIARAQVEERKRIWADMCRWHQWVLEPDGGDRRVYEQQLGAVRVLATLDKVLGKGPEEVW